MFRAQQLRPFLLMFLCLAVFLLPQAGFAAEGRVYTKYNIHAQSKDGYNLKASYANFTAPGAGHVIIPAGTEINVTKHGWRGFVFTYDGGNKKVTFEFQKKRMGMSMDEYIAKITSPEPVKYNKLSKKDKKGIADGKAYKGMTKKGVMIALGYPAAHRTPSPDSNSWTYWTNRYRTLVVEFNDKGKVVEVRR